jgi:acyl-ACP thioesterase
MSPFLCGQYAAQWLLAGYRTAKKSKARPMSSSFSMTFTALPEHIDIYGHVNNAVWVRWMEGVATAQKKQYHHADLTQDRR